MAYTDEDITRAARTAIRDHSKASDVWKSLPLQDREDAEQEAMIAAWQGYETFDPEKSAGLPVTRAIWLAKYAIVRHVDRVVRHRERFELIGLGREHDVEDPSADALDQISALEVARMAADAAGRQYPTQIATVLRLRFGLHGTEPMVMTQIASVMKLSLTDVYRYYNDGLRSLRAQLQVDSILAGA